MSENSQICEQINRMSQEASELPYEASCPAESPEETSNGKQEVPISSQELEGKKQLLEDVEDFGARVLGEYAKGQMINVGLATLGAQALLPVEATVSGIKGDTAIDVALACGAFVDFIAVTTKGKNPGAYRMIKEARQKLDESLPIIGDKLVNEALPQIVDGMKEAGPIIGNRLCDLPGAISDKFSKK